MTVCFESVSINVFRVYSHLTNEKAMSSKGAYSAYVCSDFTFLCVFFIFNPQTRKAERITSDIRNFDLFVDRNKMCPPRIHCPGRCDFILF